MSHKWVYLEAHRLEEVILLIQYLASIDEESKTNSAIVRELGVVPTSNNSNWVDVAKEHPEFFRVSGESENKAISLLARYALRKSDKESKPHELLASLIQVAIQLHDMQAKAYERRNSLLPLWAALIAGIFTLLATMLPNLL